MTGIDAEGQVRKVEESYDRAWCAGDLDGLMACLAPEAVLVNPRGEVALGAQEIRAALGGFWAGEGAQTDHSSVIGRVSVVTEDVVVVDGRAAITPRPGVEGRATFEHAFTDVLRRTPDGWLISQVRAYGLVTHE